MSNPVYTAKMQIAISWAVKAHDLDPRQKRKGTEISYIIHPLTVALILSQAGAEENLVVAGILHDVLEDSPPHNKVTVDQLRNQFGQTVAELVEQVSEPDKAASWSDRKQQALDEISQYNQQAVWLKAADVLANVRDIIADYQVYGDQAFERFIVNKESIIRHYSQVILALLDRLDDQVLRQDLEQAKKA